MSDLFNEWAACEYAAEMESLERMGYMDVIDDQDDLHAPEESM